MKNKVVEVRKDLVIVGGGMPGIVSALQAARLGMKVALVNNRGYFGGNASAEIAVNVSGATGAQEFNYYAREGGIIEELLIENMHRNVSGNRYIWDAVLYDKLRKEENIELFANTNIDEVLCESGRIKTAAGSQLASDKRFVFEAPLFIDDTGDGTLGFLAGAEYRYGREAKNEYGERTAPDQADHYVLPSTLNFQARDTGKKVTYIRPDFALNLFETDFEKYRTIPKNNFAASQWYYELDGDKNQMEDAEEIIRHHKELVYGIWDYIKNSGKYDADQYDLAYVSAVPGKREGRRFLGAYVLKEQDLMEQTDFEDTIGHGGWSVDLHAIQGFFAKEPVNRHIMLKGIYQIPYRCGYSRNIRNLFVEGRCMSTTHAAFGSTRVMATLATVGQANGAAAYLCKKYQAEPADIYKTHMKELQNLLLKENQYLVGKAYEDEKNLAKTAEVEVSSVREVSAVVQDGSEVLRRDLSLSVPVLKKFGGIRILAKVKKDTEISYWGAVPEKPENYNPEIRLFKEKKALKKMEDFQWIELPYKVSMKKACNLFFVLEANENVEIAYQKAPLTGVICARREENHSVEIVDQSTLEQKKEMWQRYQGTVCFELMEKEPVFAGENLVNGYTRPYMGANCWQARGMKGEYFVLKLEEEQRLKELVLVMDTQSDQDIYTFNENKTAEIPSVWKDFDLYIQDQSGEFVLLKEVRNHYQAMAHISLDDIKTKAVKVVLRDTWGQDFAGLFDVRLYGGF